MIRFRIISSTVHGVVDELLDEAGQAAAMARLDWEMRPQLKSKPCGAIDWNIGGRNYVYIAGHAGGSDGR